MREERLTAQIQALSRKLKLLSYHNYDSRRYQAGFPDLVLIGKRVLVRELKIGNCRLTREQEKYLDAFAAAGIDTSVWRDSDYHSGRIEREMAAAAPDWLTDQEAA